MKLEHQVCTLEQSKRLKELGIEQFKGLFRWCCFCPDPTGESYFYEPVFGDGLDTGITGEFIADAFTVAELGVMLPQSPTDNINYSWYHRNCWKGHSVGYAFHGIEPIERGWFETEAEARADLLIHLLESGLTTAADCNARLIGK